MCGSRISGAPRAHSRSQTNFNEVRALALDRIRDTAPRISFESYLSESGAPVFPTRMNVSGAPNSGTA